MRIWYGHDKQNSNPHSSVQVVGPSRTVGPTKISRLHGRSSKHVHNTPLKSRSSEMWVWEASWHLGNGSPAMAHDIFHGIVSTPPLQPSTTTNARKATLTPYMPSASRMITRQAADKQMTPMLASHNVSISISQPPPYPNGNTTSKEKFQNVPSDLIDTTHTNTCIHTCIQI